MYYIKDRAEEIRLKKKRGEELTRDEIIIDRMYHAYFMISESLVTYTKDWIPDKLAEDIRKELNELDKPIEFDEED